ncbi:hypothetical protein BDR26DRAFT_874911 [Obelidium mucronatum]|nr:hypothetical protein BDR26DRAFT_874911 [Obelidium mucronatum]
MVDLTGNTNSIPAYANNNVIATQVAAGIPPEPTLSPNRPTTVRGTLTVYLIAIPIVYIVIMLSTFLSGYSGISWFNIISALLIVGVNGMMYVAIQPHKLTVSWMTGFAYFYIVRMVLEVGFTIWALVVVASAYNTYSRSSSYYYDDSIIPWWYYAIVVAGMVIDGLVTFFMVKHAFTLRAYATQVHQITGGQVVQVVVLNKV